MSDSNNQQSVPNPISSKDALRQMYRITADYDKAFEQKVSDLLELGRSYLEIQAGFLTEISEGTQVIVQASGDHELLQAGESCPLSKAYCQKTIHQQDALTVQHAAIEGWEGDAAYEAFGLESYIGAKVIVDGDIYGTFCFAGTEPREQAFSSAEETFVELMAEWVSYELFQQRATERIEQQRDQLEEFAGVVSHDLRNPLSVIAGYVDLAEKSGNPEHFDRIRNALDQMEMLIDDLLVLAREGRAIGEMEPINVTELVEQCWSFVPTDKATLEIEQNLTIRCDCDRAQQVFENLFRNAIEHGSTSVTVRVGALPERTGLYIEDDGPGIPAGARDQVFESGFSTAQNGTGFGLSIVEQVVEAHGWEIEATDGETGGARFEITSVDFVE